MNVEHEAKLYAGCAMRQCSSGLRPAWGRGQGSDILKNIILRNAASPRANTIYQKQSIK